MVDKVGIIEESTSTYRKIEIALEDRKIITHLFAGVHGEMSHINEIIDILKSTHSEFFNNNTDSKNELRLEDLTIAEYETPQKLSFFGQEALKERFPYEKAIEVHTAYPIYARSAGLSCEQSLQINSKSKLDEFLVIELGETIILDV